MARPKKNARNARTNGMKATDSMKYEIANEFGVDGWGIYHYWFNNKQCLLTKPAEILLDNKDFNIKILLSLKNLKFYIEYCI